MSMGQVDQWIGLGQFKTFVDYGGSGRVEIFCLVENLSAYSDACSLCMSFYKTLHFEYKLPTWRVLILYFRVGSVSCLWLKSPVGPEIRRVWSGHRKLTCGHLCTGIVQGHCAYTKFCPHALHVFPALADPGRGRGGSWREREAWSWEKGGTIAEERR